MIDIINKYLIGLALLSIIFCATAIGASVLYERVIANKILNEIDYSVATLNAKGGTLESLQTASGYAALSMNSLDKSMTLMQKDLLNLRLTIDNINSASLDERFYFEHTLPHMNDQVSSILDNTNKTVVETNKTEQNVSKNINQLSISTTATLDQLNQNLKDLDAVEKTTPIYLNQLLINSSNAANQANNVLNGVAHPHGVFHWLAKWLW